MSLEKTAVLILTGVIAVLLGVAIYSAKKGKSQTFGAEGASVNGAPVQGDGAKKADVHVFSPTDLREAARREREKKPDMEKVKKGGYSTDALRRMEAEAKASRDGKTPADDTETITVTVNRGETYAKIAKRVLGNSALAGRVREANQNIDDRKLKSGMTFSMKVPKKKAPKKPESVADLKGGSAKDKAKKTDAPAAGGKYVDYVIQKNDNYAKIAKKVLGDSARKDDVRLANKNIEERRLRYGAHIRIPVNESEKTPSEGKTAALSRDTTDSIEDF